MYLIIKVVGSFLVVAGGFLAGQKISKQYKKRSTILKQMQEALKYADDAIAIENTLLDEVLKSCGEKFCEKEDVIDLWTRASENLKTEFGSFENAWARACDEYFEETQCLKDKDKECIVGIGKAIGLANTQRQTAHVTSTLQRLQSLEKESLSAEEKEGKNAVKIALAMAVAAVVILF